MTGVLSITTAQSPNQQVAMYCQSTVDPGSDYFPLSCPYGSYHPAHCQSWQYSSVSEELSHKHLGIEGKMNAEAKGDIALLWASKMWAGKRLPSV